MCIWRCWWSKKAFSLSLSFHLWFRVNRTINVVVTKPLFYHNRVLDGDGKEKEESNQASLVKDAGESSTKRSKGTLGKEEKLLSLRKRFVFPCFLILDFSLSLLNLYIHPYCTLSDSERRELTSSTQSDADDA